MAYKKVRKGEIWTCKLTSPIGSEQTGTRPVIIIQNDKGNVYSPTTIVASVTSHNKNSYMPTHVRFSNEKLKYDSIALLEQVKTVDKTSLGTKIGELTEEQFAALNRAIKISFDV